MIYGSRRETLLRHRENYKEKDILCYIVCYKYFILEIHKISKKGRCYYFDSEGNELSINNVGEIREIFETKEDCKEFLESKLKRKQQEVDNMKQSLQELESYIEFFEGER